VGTKKISQLETISDSNISGEAVLPIVVSDPLIPNRKAKVNQLFRGLAQGTKTDPGLAFDLDRDSGLYQAAYDQIGIAFGDGGLYMTRIDNGNSSVSLYVTAIDDVANNADIVFAPKGTGSVKVTGQFLMSDEQFLLEDAQGPKIRFEAGNVGTGTNTRIMTLPEITAGNGTTLVGADTTQTLTNKTLLIDEDNFVLIDGAEEAIFQINWPTTSGTRRSYFLPDAGSVTTTAEPTATSSTLLDTKTEQIVLSKTLVSPKLAASAEVNAFWAQFSTAAITANRTITVPDQNIELVGTASNQNIQNKIYENIVFADQTDNTKKISILVDNSNTLTNSEMKFPPTTALNTGGGSALFSTIVTDLATQSLENKIYIQPKIQQLLNSSAAVTFSTDNITANRTIKFPDADATLLSTENVTLDDVAFGAGLGASHLTGRTKLQQFFYAGF
tara:strand:- start:2375 stop:3706 length:1332 start_codon:yes stop_codon:yes gene_type:complete